MERGTKLALAALAGVGIAVFFVRKARASEGGDPRESLAPSKDLLADLNKDATQPTGGDSTGGGSTGGGSTGGGSTGGGSTGGRYASKNAWGTDVIKAYQERITQLAQALARYYSGDANKATLGGAKPPLVALAKADGVWGPKTQEASDKFLALLDKALIMPAEAAKTIPQAKADLSAGHFYFLSALDNAYRAAYVGNGNKDLTVPQIEFAMANACYEFNADKKYISTPDHWAFRAAAVAPKNLTVPYPTPKRA